MRETSKTRQTFGALENAVVRGRILDIGAGGDPIHAQAIAFDVDSGDANFITAFEPASFDLVYSSHCLEHMDDPARSIANWWSLVKPEGHLFVVVPDEDLYEQGVFPSRFSKEHKHTFTIAKKRSWSPNSVNLFELVRALPSAEIVTMVLNDIGYDRSIAYHGPTRGGGFFRWLRKQYWSLRKRDLCDPKPGFERWIARRVGWDQLVGPAMAQIEVIVRKRA